MGHCFRLISFATLLVCHCFCLLWFASLQVWHWIRLIWFAPLYVWHWIQLIWFALLHVSNEMVSFGSCGYMCVMNLFPLFLSFIPFSSVCCIYRRRMNLYNNGIGGKGDAGLLLSNDDVANFMNGKIRDLQTYWIAVGRRTPAAGLSSRRLFVSLSWIVAFAKTRRKH